MTQSLPFARFYEAARDSCNQPKLVANWLMGELSKRLNAIEATIEDSPVQPQHLAALIVRIEDQTISNAAARQVFDGLWLHEGSAGTFSAQEQVDLLIESKGLRQMDDSVALQAIIDTVLADNPKSVDEFRAGKDRAFNALVGQVMKASRGKANPTQVNALLKARLGG